MQQDLVELTVFGIDGLFGQLTSRIYSTLAYSGRCTAQEIARRTALPPRQVESTLVVLIQHHLALHYLADNGRTYYEANGDAAYNTVFRYGKLAHIVEERFGSLSAEILMNVVLLGHARASDLEYALNLRTRPDKRESHSKPQADEAVINGDTATNGDTHHAGGPKPKSSIESISQLHYLLDGLLGAGFLKLVDKHQFMPECDRTTEAEQTVLANSFQQGVKGNKQKAEFMMEVNKLKRNWRDMEDDYVSQALDFHYRGVTKRVKLNGNKATGFDGKSSTTRLDDLDDGFRVSEKVVVQPNFDKCNLVLRNEQLVKLAHRYIGETTSKVFAALLRQLEERMIRCYDLLEVEEEEEEEVDPFEDTTSVEPLEVYLISPHAILKAIDPKLDLNVGLHGQLPVNGVNGHSSNPVDISDNADSGSDDDPVNHRRPAPSGRLETSDPRLACLESHLQLLQRDPRHFVKQTGREWTVPFRTLTRHLIQHTIEDTITARHGTLATRIVRILLKNFSTEERTLASLAIVKPKEVRAVTNTLLQAGLLETQEIPRDNNRATNRLTWLFTYDPVRARKQLLTDSYRAMTRLLRRAEVEKAKIAQAIDKSERTDVVGNEDKYLNAGEKEALARWRDVEGRLLSMVGKIDGLVALLRDFSPVDDAFVGNRERPRQMARTAET